jgi:CheY-like chemotaxis protein
MTASQGIPATVLLAAALERAPVSAALEGAGFSIIEAESGVAALGRARVVRPDAIVLSNVLPDMSGIEACRLLHADPLVGGNTPVVILSGENPSPAERVAGLSAGVWDFFRHPRDSRELALKLQTYVEARRNVAALSDNGIDPVSGLQARPALARRIRELGGLMTRMHGALSCIVFDTETPDAGAPAVVAQITRVSDVVGILSPTQFALLAPSTNATGAAALCRRVAAVLRNVATAGGRGVQALLIGYDAVDNLTYAPINPPDLIARATAAVRNGKPEPANHWLRRYEPGAPPAEGPRNTPVNMMIATDRRES